jgi:hypothetical protein
MRDESSRLWKVGDALSQLANVALMPNHKQTNANESISGRAYRQQWRIQKVINLLFFWQENHCKNAYELDLGRARASLDEA